MKISFYYLNIKRFDKTIKSVYFLYIYSIHCSVHGNLYSDVIVLSDPLLTLTKMRII